MITEVAELSQETIDEFANTCPLRLPILEGGGICDRPAKYYAKLHLTLEMSEECYTDWTYICEYCFKVLTEIQSPCYLCGEKPYKEGIRV